MKRTIFAFIALLTLVASFAQLQDAFPGSIRQFLNERDDIQRLKSYAQPYALQTYNSQFAPPQMINGIEMVDAFIDIDNASAIPALKSHGVIINCEFDGFVTAKVPVKQLSILSRIPGVTDIEISRTLSLCTDSTMRATHAWQELNGPDYGLPQAYDGTGVIIGVIDAGFDYRHLAFRCADDTSRTRIARVYDMNDTTGHPAFVGQNRLSGSVFMGEQLDTMTYDTNGSHGTHTASIAAGMHVGGYGGMAPGADIVLCSVRNMELIITETDVVNAMKYIYSYADSVGKPCVISLSVSSNQGARDGLDRISKAVAQTTGPGHIFVISAGNAGNKAMYTYGPVTIPKPFHILLGSEADKLNTDYTYYYRSLWCEAWVRNLQTRSLCKFFILDKYTKRIVWESDLINTYKKINASEISEYYDLDPSIDSVGYLDALISQSISGKYKWQIHVNNLKTTTYTIDETGRYRSRYEIGVSFYPPKLKYPRQPDSCYIDAWMVAGAWMTYNDVIYVDEIDENGDTISTQEISDYFRGRTDACCINTYAVHDSTISAGAYVARTSYYSLNEGHYIGDPNGYTGGIYLVSAYEFPGYGPTGQHLPTIMAPGYYVVAAGSRYSYFNTTWHRDLVMRKDGYVWGEMSGTSMAAPTVAGIIAEWLQINPSLSPGDIKNIFSQTAIRDNYTNDPSFGRRFGPNGKIDALAGVEYLLSLMEDDILLGDANGDGLITIRDLTIMINYLLSHDTSSYNFVFANADMNNDGFITIRDVTLFINYLLSLNSTAEPTQ